METVGNEKREKLPGILQRGIIRNDCRLAKLYLLKNIFLVLNSIMLNAITLYSGELSHWQQMDYFFEKLSLYEFSGLLNCKILLREKKMRIQ